MLKPVNCNPKFFNQYWILFLITILCIEKVANINDNVFKEMKYLWKIQED